MTNELEIRERIARLRENLNKTQRQNGRQAVVGTHNLIQMLDWIVDGEGRKFDRDLRPETGKAVKLKSWDLPGDADNT